MEHFGLVIDDESPNAGGKQCIVMPEGHTIPICACDGSPRVDMQIPTDAEMDKHPHVFVTADSTWDPSALDNEFEEEFYDAVTELPEVQARRDGADPRVDDYSFLRSRQDYEILF